MIQKYIYLQHDHSKSLLRTMHAQTVYTRYIRHVSISVDPSIMSLDHEEISYPVYRISLSMRERSGLNTSLEQTVYMLNSSSAIRHPMFQQSRTTRLTNNCRTSTDLKPEYDYSLLSLLIKQLIFLKFLNVHIQMKGKVNL